MKFRKYKVIRISDNQGNPTYGDKYFTYYSSKELKHNEIVTDEKGVKYIVLFEMEESK